MSRTLSGPEWQAQGQRITKARAEWADFLTSGTVATTGEIMESLRDEFKLPAVLASKLLKDLREKFPQIAEGDVPDDEPAYTPAPEPSEAQAADSSLPQPYGWPADFIPVCTLRHKKGEPCDCALTDYAANSSGALMSLSGQGRRSGKVLALTHGWTKPKGRERFYRMGYQIQRGGRPGWVSLMQILINYKMLKAQEVRVDRQLEKSRGLGEVHKA